MNWRNHLEAGAVALCASGFLHSNLFLLMQSVDTEIHRYLLDRDVAARAHASSWILIGLVAALLFPLARRAVRQEAPDLRARALLVGLAICGLCFLALHPTILQAAVLVGVESDGFRLADLALSTGAAILLVAGLGWWFRRGLVKAAWVLLLVIAPAGPILLVNSTRILANGPSPVAAAVQKPRADSPAPHAGPVVLIVFDELDGALLRARLGELPAFRALSGQAVQMTDARPPAEWTLISLPSYLTGERVLEAKPVRNRDLQIRTRERPDEWQSWRAHPENLFKIAQKTGFRSYSAGFFHPYCEIFAGTLEACEFLPSWGMSDHAAWATSVAGMPWYRRPWELAVHNLPAGLWTRRYDGVPFANRLWTLHSREAALARAGLDTAARFVDETLPRAEAGFHFIHIPSPHPPEQRPGQGYGGNLHDADEFLARVVHLLRQDGRYDSAAILVTSDHSLRSFWRTTPSLDPVIDATLSSDAAGTVPLIVKLPGQKEPTEFADPLDAVAVHDLTAAALQGMLRTIEEAKGLLERWRIAKN